MNLEHVKYFSRKLIIGISTLVFISSCGGSDSDSGVGQIQLYNVAANSPSIFLTVGKDDDDDFNEAQHSGVKFPSTGGQFDYIEDTYDIDLSWQDEDDISDLEIIYESTITISSDTISFLVFAEDINSPNVLKFDIPIVDDEDDDDDELFNLRILNMHTMTEGADIYYSESDETFEQAILLGHFNYTEMSDNQKIEQDDYVFYITRGGSSEVVYRSNEITFSTTTQFIMAIRENTGAGDSPFVLDRVSNTINEHSDADAQSKLRIYNGIVKHELIPNYTGTIDFHLDGFDDTPEISSLVFGEYSDSTLTDFGDYSISVAIPDNTELLIENHLLTLDTNSDKTVFFYLLEEAVDDDDDGDVDENGDGEVDEYEITTNTLVVENSQNQSIRDHQINIINLIDDFDNVRVFFVLSDETTETASNKATAIFAKPNSVTLRNNTYNVFIIGKEDTSDLILTTMSITLNEETSELFLVLEENEDTVSGYQMFISNQRG